MTTITTRSGKGSPLTNDEVDANFTNLNTDKAELSGAAFTGAITTNSTFDGRDVATDGTKLDGIEASADVTDTANVTAAGALMDSELTSEASVKALNQGVATTDSPTFAGLTTTADVSFGDNDKAIFGADSDMSLFHNGNNAFLDNDTGTLFIQTDALSVKNAAGTESVMLGAADGAVTLYHNNSVKLATTATGIDVTGSITTDGLTSVGGFISIGADGAGDDFRFYGDTSGRYMEWVSSADSLLFRDGAKALFGNGSDLEIYHSGSSSFIVDTGTGNLNLQTDGTSIDILGNSGAEYMARFISNGAASLYYDAGKKLETLSTGVNITGTAVADSYDIGSLGTLGSVSTDRLFIATADGLGLQFDFDNSRIVPVGADGSTYNNNVSLGASSLEFKNLFLSGSATLGGATISGNLSVDGGTIKLDGNYPVGTDNVALGNTALDSLVSGNYSTAIGANALTANTASSNTALGFAALEANTSGTQNTAVGMQALTDNTTANNNVAVGHRALFANTTGTANVALGSTALTAATTADNNTALGHQTLYSNTTGASNTSVGVNASYSNTTGGNNTAMGLNALYSTTTGSNNVAIGRQALNSNTTASNNTSVGYAALFANTTGGSNVAIGRDAMISNTTGSQNVAIGYDALRNSTTQVNTTAVGYRTARNSSGANFTAIGAQAFYTGNTGNNNVGVGVNAAYANTSGANLTGLGTEALRFNTTGSNNTALGYRTLYSNTTASNNTAVGYQSLLANTTGQNNTSLGYQALTANVGGGRSVAVGSQALAALEDGSENVAVGQQAMKTETSGQRSVAVGFYALAVQNNTGAGTNAYNTAVGALAGQAVTTATQNTLIGGLAGDALTTGDNSTAIGFQALSTATTAVDNVAIGSGAGFAITTGSNNTAIGTAALDANTTASNNTAVGFSALTSNTTASSSTALGYAAGYYSTGERNTFIGEGCGFNVTTGTRNTFIGQDSGVNVTTGTKNTILGRYNGNQGGLDIRTSSNNIVLSDGDGNPRFVINSSASAGFNVVPPTTTTFQQVFYSATGAVSSLNNLHITNNAVYNNGWKRISGGKAVLNQIDYNNSRFQWYTATDNTAGTDISWNSQVSIDADGLKFGSDTAAANALDDYEEGTWTPNFVASTTTVTVYHASYVKIGKMVTVNFYIANISPATSGDVQYITGLPYAMGSGSHYPAGVIAYSDTADVSNLGVIGLGGNSSIYFHYLDGTSAAALTRDNWNSIKSSGLTLIISMTYEAA